MILKINEDFVDLIVSLLLFCNFAKFIAGTGCRKTAFQLVIIVNRDIVIKFPILTQQKRQIKETNIMHCMFKGGSQPIVRNQKSERASCGISPTHTN